MINRFNVLIVASNGREYNHRDLMVLRLHQLGLSHDQIAELKKTDIELFSEDGEWTVRLNFEDGLREFNDVLFFEDMSKTLSEFEHLDAETEELSFYEDSDHLIRLTEDEVEAGLIISQLIQNLISEV